MNDMEIIDMTKKLPHGHNIGGGNSQKRRQEYKKEKNYWIELLMFNNKKSPCLESKGYFSRIIPTSGLNTNFV